MPDGRRSAPTARPATPSDRAVIRRLSEPIGGPTIVADGRLIDLDDHPGFVVGAPVPTGFAIWRSLDGETAELTAIRTSEPRAGAGSALLAAVESHARDAGHASLVVETTADNAPAQAFYRARGFTFERRIENGFEAALRIKGLTGPLNGRDGRPLRDLTAFRKRL